MVSIVFLPVTLQKRHVTITIVQMLILLAIMCIISPLITLTLTDL